MKIAVCDDEKQDLSWIESHFVRLSEQQHNLEVEYFLDGEKLLASWEQTSYDLIMIDTELDTMNGLEIVKRGRQLGRRPYIIYLSSHDKYALEAYETEAYHYLIKPVEYSRFAQITERVCRLYARDHHIYTTMFGHERIALNIGEICYFDSYGRITHVHTTGGTYQISTTLDHEESLLPGQFIRIHQGFLVNMDYIRRIKGHTVVMSDGEELDISVRKKREVWVRFTDYVKKHTF